MKAMEWHWKNFDLLWIWKFRAIIRWNLSAHQSYRK